MDAQYFDAELVRMRNTINGTKPVGVRRELTPVEKEMRIAMDAAHLTVQQYASQNAMASFVLMQPRENGSRVAIQIGEYLYTLEELENMKAGLPFANSPERVASLREYMQIEMESIRKAFSENHMLLPSRIRGAMNFTFIPAPGMEKLPDANKRIQFSYHSPFSPTPNIDVEFNRWRNVLETRGWNTLSIL